MPKLVKTQASATWRIMQMKTRLAIDRNHFLVIVRIVPQHRPGRIPDKRYHKAGPATLWSPTTTHLMLSVHGALISFRSRANRAGVDKLGGFSVNAC